MGLRLGHLLCLVGRASLLGLLASSGLGLGARGISPLVAWFPGCLSLRGSDGTGPTLLLSRLPWAGPIHFPEQPALQRKATVVLGEMAESVVSSFVNGTLYKAEPKTFSPQALGLGQEPLGFQGLHSSRAEVWECPGRPSDEKVGRLHGSSTWGST